jgi:ribonuclease inhibitor
MREIRLNGAKMTDRAAAHAYLKRKLDLPDYYGYNLDALWDCLSTDFSPRKITLVNPEIILENLGPYGISLIELIKNAGQENSCLQVVIASK